MTTRDKYKALVAQRTELITSLISGDLKLPKPDAYAHDQYLVQARNKARMQVVQLTRELNLIEHLVLQEEIDSAEYEYRSGSNGVWRPATIKRLLFLLSRPEEEIKRAAERYDNGSGGWLVGMQIRPVAVVVQNV